MNFKSIAFSGLAVMVAVVMSLSLLAQPVQAAVATTTQLTFAAMALPTEAELNDGTAAAGTMSANTGGAYTAAATNLVLTESAAAQWANGTLIVNVPSGWQLQDAGTCTVAAVVELTCTPTINGTGTQLTWTLAGGPSAAARTLTSGSLELRPRSNTAAAGNFTIDASSTAIGNGLTGLSADQVVGSVAAPTAYAANAAPYTINLSMVTGTANCGTTNPTTTVLASVAADGSTAPALCAAVRAASGAPVVGATVTFTVSTGVVSTGTSKTTTAITNSAGNASTNYRGGGNIAGTDTAIASNTSLNAVGTLAITLTAAGGTTASKVSFNAPTNASVAANITNVSPNYQSPLIGTNISVLVADSAGLGVNTQTVLISTDKGGVAIGFNAACSTAKSVTGASATAAPTVGATAITGIVQVTYCANQLDAAGKATLTAQNISTTMANATTSISHAGRPAKVEATATGNAISAKVVDAGGNVVADGTPVRFTISANAGAVSTACTTTSNGAASSVVALIQATGTVIVSTDWNETGGPASCAAGTPAAVAPFIVAGTGAGSQQLAASVMVPGGTSTAGGGSTPSTPSTPSAGSVTSGSVPAAGGFGFFVYGGPVSGLAAATSCPAGTAAFWATVNGEFVTNVPGTTISAVNAAFNAAFPNGIPAGTALLGKCK